MIVPGNLILEPSNSAGPHPGGLLVDDGNDMETCNFPTSSQVGLQRLAARSADHYFSISSWHKRLLPLDSSRHAKQPINNASNIRGWKMTGGSTWERLYSRSRSHQFLLFILGSPKSGRRLWYGDGMVASTPWFADQYLPGGIGSVLLLYPSLQASFTNGDRRFLPDQ